MIEFNRNFQLTPNEADMVKIKVVGIGGAGSNALDRIMLDGFNSGSMVALNTDVQSLTSSVATEKIQIGREMTRGLGAGGDPELGLAAAEEAVEEIRQSLEGAGMVFICVGLGGGTGSGAAPLVASIAKQQGALVVVFATMPFTFEGKRRRLQANEALACLQDSADAVICFENDKMGDAVPPKAGIHQAFAAADQTISQSVKAVCAIFDGTGLIHIGFDDLSAALRSGNARCVFGFGEAEGDNRSHDALARALKNPLMDRGRMLSDAQNVLVHIGGGPGMTLTEVQILMEELGKHIGDETRIHFGTSVDAKMGNRLSVTIITSVGGESSEPVPQRRQKARPDVEAELEQELPAEPEQFAEPEFAAEIEPPVEAEEQEFVESVPIEPPPVLRPKPQIARMPKAVPPPIPIAAKTAPEPRQETLQFEPVARGRFEKSEPTIVDGQDLDVPTFLRRNIKVK